MKTIRAGILFALLFLIAACQGTARVTTPSERLMASDACTLIETGLTVAWAAKELSQEKFTLAMQQLQTLRADIAASETTPVTFAAVMARATNLSLQWLNKDVTQAKPSVPPPTMPAATEPAKKED